MLISELAKEVHENAVAHGWWDDEREAPEIIALIHSEWSEALEEARAGRPMVWYDIYDKGDDCGGGGRCGAVVDQGICHGKAGKCELNHKPEGVAVELIDGCIRILDYFGRVEAMIEDADGSPSAIEGLYSEDVSCIVPKKLPELIAYLHAHTSEAYRINESRPEPLYLLSAIASALSWVKNQSIDPLAILLEKHAYNKTRPYKHGKKF